MIDYVLFNKDPRKISDKLINSEITEEEKKLVEKLKKKGFKEFVSSRNHDIYEFEPDNLGEQTFRKNFREIANKIKFDDTQLNQLLTDIGIELTRKRIKKNVGKDRIVIEVINAIDEIDKSVNIFMARLRELYGLHFPEINRLVEKHEKYAKLVSSYGLRDNIEKTEFSSLAKDSMGIDLSEKDELVIKEFASDILGLYKLRDHLEKYVAGILKEIAPNFSGIAGPLLAARLMSLVGGFEKLAKKPSSTMQLLGAEKSLFRYLRGKGRSPRHGILFMHPLVQRAPSKLRGKVARVLASKLSIAIKMDFYGKEDKSVEMKKDVEERVEKILSE